MERSGSESERELTDQEVDPDERLEGLKGFTPELFVEEFFSWFEVSWGRKATAQGWIYPLEYNRIGKELGARHPECLLGHPA